MQSSAISFSVSVDNPDEKMKNLINSLSGEFDIFYNDQLELITIKNYRTELPKEIVMNREVLLEQRTRKNYQVLLKNNTWFIYGNSHFITILSHDNKSVF